MAFSNLKLNDVKEKYGLEEFETDLFPNLQPVVLSSNFIENFADFRSMPLPSLRAKSVFIIAPILLEAWKICNKRFCIFSDEKIDIDLEWVEKCSFVLNLNPKTIDVENPFFILVQPENDNINLGFGECIAQMYAAQKFNEIKKRDIPVIYGCVTTGDDWQFLKLKENTITFDNKRFYLNEVSNILGAFQYIVDKNYK